MRYTKNNTFNRGENYHWRSVVRVECGCSTGTAVCVSKSGTAGDLYLTCAHVVQYKTQSVILHYDGYVIRGKVIYATHAHDSNDIAVIVGEPTTADVVPCEISINKTPLVGQKVFAVGYVCGDNAAATVFGCIQSALFGTITTSCNVCTGFSGGPVFTSNNRLLGLTVGKLSVGTVHFVLPTTEFIGNIKKYIVTKDIKVLNSLESKCSLKKVFWNGGIPHTNLLCHI